MRLVWLLAALVLFSGCATQEPAPPPEDDDGATDDGGEGEGDETSEPADGTNETDARANETEEEPMQIHSPAFADGEEIPEEHTADGADRSPPLNLTDVPDAAESLALVVDDPDAPRDEPWVHWLIWNLPPEAETIAEGYPPSGDGKAFQDARQGTNDFDEQRYNGPAPPPDDEAHRYRFQLFALDRTLDVEEGAQRAQLENAMEGAVIEQATLTGTYER